MNELGLLLPDYKELSEKEERCSFSEQTVSKEIIELYEVVSLVVDNANEKDVFFF
jgi:hypothetical protein